MPSSALIGLLTLAALYLLALLLVFALCKAASKEAPVPSPDEGTEQVWR